VFLLAGSHSIQGSILGGGGLSSVSAHLPGRPACVLPDLPKALNRMTLDSVAGVPTVCGGRGSGDNVNVQTCLQLEGQSWRQVARLEESRAGHYSWLLPEGLLLLGGGDYLGTTELAVATGSHQPGYRFEMDKDRQYGCSIVTQGGLVITAHWLRAANPKHQLYACVFVQQKKSST
jgi:hypothetical protein